MLTEAMNRNAYENMIRYLDEQELELHTTGVVLLGLDNLKEINDNFGHEKGDEALKLCYQCIRQAFPSEQESGLIIPAGRWIIREALQACKKLRETIPDFQVSINISQIQIEKSDVIQDISAELENAKLPPEALIVELTESALLEDNSNARHFLKELRKAGIRPALDDFGTGYSNFHYLNELRPDIIKIDRSFTAQAIKDAKEYDLLKRFCTMIHRLNIKICIEGVETEDEWEKIRLMDPDYSQGYLWGKPCSFDELLQKGLRV